MQHKTGQWLCTLCLVVPVDKLHQQVHPVYYHHQQLRFQFRPWLGVLVRA